MTTIVIDDQDGNPIEIDLELCKLIALKAVRDLSNIETEKYDFSTCIAMLQSVCISILLDAGWEKEELIGEISAHIDQLTKKSKQRVLH
jgi:hypothetical protein